MQEEACTSSVKIDIEDMELETLKDLYIQELKDLYSAENQLLKALPKMEKAATNRQLWLVSASLRANQVTPTM